MTCLGAFSVTFPDHGVSYPSHLGLSGAVEDRVLVYSPQVLHDVIWTHDPAHLDQEIVGSQDKRRPLSTLPLLPPATWPHLLSSPWH